jgi:two-component system cell cycle response regulator
MRRKQAADRHRAHVQSQLRLAVRDPLTGLYNRRFALNQIVGMAEAARMEGLTYAVMIIDLDRFKDVNDRWGHSAGDSVLAIVGDRLLANIRTGDLLARYGGEEFIVALPSTAEGEALAVAERLRHAVGDAPFPLTGGAEVRVTASIGVALGQPCEPVQGVIDRADRMLYASKRGGRDRVTLDTSAEAGPAMGRVAMG